MRIDEIAFNTDAQTLTLETSAHFNGAIGYEEQSVKVFVFGGVSELRLELDLTEGVRISNVDVTPTVAEFRLEIDLNIGGGSVSRGRRSITANFKSIAVR